VIFRKLGGHLVNQCQYCSVFWVGDGAARVIGTRLKALDKVGRQQPWFVFAAVGQALEELGDNGAGIAPRAIERGIGYMDQQFPCMAGIKLLNARPDGVGGRRQVGTRVTVRHREHVDLVELVLGTDESFEAGAQAAVQANAVQITDALRSTVHTAKYLDLQQTASLG